LLLFLISIFVLLHVILAKKRYLNISLALYFLGDLMPVKFKRTTFKSGNSYRITIPMEIVKALDIKEKEALVIWLNDSQIIMEKSK